MMKRIIVMFLVFLMPVNVQAMSFTNETKDRLTVKIYSGGSKCYQSVPIEAGAKYTRPKPPTKCSVGIYKLKAISGKKVCRIVDLSWEADVVFSIDGDEMKCGEQKQAGGH